MFQFPGFALEDLCIQSTSPCLTRLFCPTASQATWGRTPAWHQDSRINKSVSGGLPHSEIHGSKLILSSSWLIAEYHVFHRLLLPRHPPNALFALDLIQKKQDFLCCPTASLLEGYLHPPASLLHRTRSCAAVEAGNKPPPFFRSKAYFPARP